VLRPALATREIIVPFWTMPMRVRKLIGAFALFILVTAWALLAMAVAQFPVIRDNAFLSVAYYVIAGLGWIVPAMPLVSWMSAPQSSDRSSGSRL
jgi:hypothetical protein